MDKNCFLKLLEDTAGSGNVAANEPMKNHTSFKIGGPADYMVFPRSTAQIIAIVKLCIEHKHPYYVMGNGTNLVVRDKGIRGVVIKTEGYLKSYIVEGEEITAESGILLSRLSSVALENGLSGIEFASGIPGTLGGAVAMNAGAYGPEMKDVVVETEYIDTEGNLKLINGEQHRFGYRSSIIQKENGLVLKTKLRLKKGDKQEIKALMEDLNRRRRSTQPLEMPSAGSVFRRPEGYYTGKLIQDCGLRGFRIGGAEVSEKHCGFIVNAGNATSDDVIKLIKHIQDTVMERFGVELVTEVKITGEE